MKTNRLIQLLRWNIIGRKGRILRGFLGGMIGVFFGMTCANGFWFSETPAEAGAMSSMATILIIVLCLMILKSATGISFNTNTKTDFISYAMLPATNLEKYIANWIYVSLFLTLLYVVSFIAGDLLQMLVSVIVYGEASSLTQAAGRLILPSLRVSELSGVGFSTTPLGLIFAHAAFILGGTLFRKHQFIYTCLLMWIVIPFILVMIFGGIGSGLVWWLDAHDYMLQIEWYVGADFATAAIFVAEAALIAFCYWMSYRLFRRSQIINNRIINS
ncbi:MAG: hypothetical protein NC344_05280 [Bacteroidales bacterium]|nr:hypothetical protein [Bacteroidales bacterium]MCM1147235.1 hypothetical protein [Bacteroidales bacterium]MCM1207202.1 hypothetical protein [Bacillota bacterium]MCM1509735.1 hypothetical protein [Clostridium sp.]